VTEVEPCQGGGGEEEDIVGLGGAFGAALEVEDIALVDALVDGDGDICSCGGDVLEL
jgi:hypothetical protein